MPRDDVATNIRYKQDDLRALLSVSANLAYFCAFLLDVPLACMYNMAIC